MSESGQNFGNELKDWEKIKFDLPIVEQQTHTLSHEAVWKKVEENLGRKLEKIDFKYLK